MCSHSVRFSSGKFEFTQSSIKTNSKCGIHTGLQITHVHSSSFIICDNLVFFFSFSFFVSRPFLPFTEPTEEPLVDLSDVLNSGADILGVLGKPSSDSGASYISQAITVAECIKSHLAVGF